MHMGGQGGASIGGPSMSVDIDHMDMDAVESSANSIVPSIAMQVQRPAFALIPSQVGPPKLSCLLSNMEK